MSARVPSSWLRRPGKKSVAIEQIRIPQGAFGLVTDARADREAVLVELPFPPATNNLFFNVPGKGRVKSERYCDWLDEAAAMIAQQKPGRIAGKFEVEIEISRPDNRRRDLDGLLKPLLDCLVANRITADDSLVQKITAKWSSEGRGVRVTARKWGGA